MSLKVRTAAHGSREYEAMVDLRRRVLRTPLGLDFRASELAAEREQIHAGLYDAHGLAACLVYVPGVPWAKVRQVAVASEKQGRGYGRSLMGWAEDEARHTNYMSGILLHARADVVPFYERLGYVAEGEAFEEVGLPHQRMIKKL